MLLKLRNGFLFGLGLMLAVGVTTLFAQSLNEFAGGDLISASTINANFANLKSRLDTLTTRMDSALPSQENDQAGSYSNTSTSYTTITPSVTVTTSGSPVWVGLTGFSNGSSSELVTDLNTDSLIQILRDGTPIYTAHMRGDQSTLAIPPCSVWTIDRPAAGTYTYSVQARLIAGARIRVFGTRLIAMRFNEL